MTITVKVPGVNGLGNTEGTRDVGKDIISNFRGKGLKIDGMEEIHVDNLKVEDELDDSDENGEFYLVKGNTPTRDDIFRYKVKLKNPKEGDKIVFLNAGAYNYWCDFCSLDKLETLVRNV